MLSKTLKWLDEYAELGICVVLLSGMTLLTFLQVVMRYVFSNSLSWSEELARFTFIWMVYLGISYACKHMKHIRIEASLALFPRKWRGVVVILGDVILLCFAAFVAYKGMDIVKFQHISKSAALKIPMSFIYAAPVVGFSLVYILILRNAVKKFRAELIGHIAEFIDPGLVHERNRPIPAGEMEESLLFGRLAKPEGGPDHFRGRAGEAAVEFSDLQVRAVSGEMKSSLGGLYFVARYPRRFTMPLLSFPSTLEVSRSELEAAMRSHGYPLAEGMVRLDDPANNRQVLVPSGQEQRLRQLIPGSVIDDLNRLRCRQGVETLLSAFDNRLHIVMLSANKQPDSPGMFEGFDFGNCKLFCHNARLAMRIAGEAASRIDH